MKRENPKNSGYSEFKKTYLLLKAITLCQYKTAKNKEKFNKNVTITKKTQSS